VELGQFVLVLELFDGGQGSRDAGSDVSLELMQALELLLLRDRHGKVGGRKLGVCCRALFQLAHRVFESELLAAVLLQLCRRPG